MGMDSLLGKKAWQNKRFLQRIFREDDLLEDTLAHHLVPYTPLPFYLSVISGERRYFKEGRLLHRHVDDQKLLRGAKVAHVIKYKEDLSWLGYPPKERTITAVYVDGFAKYLLRPGGRLEPLQSQER